MLGGCGQQLDVHAGLEHAPGGREAAAAEQSGQRPHELGGRLHLQPLSCQNTGSTVRARSL